jgi:hypothetical protein
MDLFIYPAIKDPRKPDGVIRYNIQFHPWISWFNAIRGLSEDGI